MPVVCLGWATWHLDIRVHGPAERVVLDRLAGQVVDRQAGVDLRWRPTHVLAYSCSRGSPWRLQL